MEFSFANLLQTRQSVLVAGPIQSVLAIRRDAQRLPSPVLDVLHRASKSIVEIVYL